MKAALLKDYGSAEHFEITDVPKPEVGAGEILINVKYAGLRWGDIMGRNGIPIRAAKPPFVPGQEAAGFVEAVGEGVTRFKPGDRVIAQPQQGGYGEFVSVPQYAAGHIPEHVRLDVALVYRVNLPTAYLIVNEWAKVQEGESVLVHAAAGGVGSLIVQILKRKFENVLVIGLAGNDDKVKAVLESGADHAINYKTADYVQEVGNIVGHKPRGFAPGAEAAGVHVALNGVGGSTLKTDPRVIRRLGRWVLFGTPAGVEPINVYANSYDSITIMPFSMIPFQGTPTAKRAREFSRDWLHNETLTPPTVHPIENIAEVQQQMERGETIGKVVFAI